MKTEDKNKPEEQGLDTGHLKEQLETEFPLSGGESEDNFPSIEIDSPAPVEEEEFKDRLDQAFPLSGGETDKDLE